MPPKGLLARSLSRCVTECPVSGQLIPELFWKGNGTNRGTQYLGCGPRGCQFVQADLIFRNNLYKAYGKCVDCLPVLHTICFLWMDIRNFGSTMIRRNVLIFHWMRTQANQPIQLTRWEMKFRGSKCEIMHNPNTAQLCRQTQKDPGFIMDSSVKATENCLETKTEMEVQCRKLLGMK